MSERACGVLIYAHGHPYKAIAKAFAGTKGRIATFGEIVEAHMARPDLEPFQNRQVLSRTVLAAGRKKGTRSYQAFVSDETGLMEDPTALRAAYDIRFNQRKDSEVVGMAPASVHFGQISMEKFSSLGQLERQPRMVPTRVTRRQDRTRTKGLKIGVRDQLNAVLGHRAAPIIAARRATTGVAESSGVNHTQEDIRWSYDSWRRGNVCVTLFHDGGLEDPAFLRGEYALATPLSYMGGTACKSDRHVAGIPWEPCVCYVLAWRDVNVQDGEIICDPEDIDSLMLGRADCFHPTEEAFPAGPYPYILNPHGQTDTDGFMASPLAADDKGCLESDGVTRCVVDIEEKLGECILTEQVINFPCKKSRWQRILAEAPPALRPSAFAQILPTSESSIVSSPWRSLIDFRSNIYV